jgi:hypothetical protein
VAECDGEHCRRLLALARLAQNRADADEREQLKRDRRRVVCSLERVAERPLRLADVAEGQLSKADPAAEICPGGVRPAPCPDDRPLLP